ncbi:hypothetical protein EJ04DRAFT_574081 [Polyplosphaeria fusca]|uniref:Myb-like domain-containing protein n=1 Tax=Polyplosphaeria fusca TaxID=682080 RepID=A0A9P4V640_9PLEO|nr:hypothetical protein EJ04DRAFT_574081 [Polyplosphaeria fusca]
MADRRSVRSSSRRITPTPQPQPQPQSATNAQAGRASRARGTRSASREVDQHVTTNATRPPRRRARGASVASESDHDAHPPRKTNKKGHKQTLELATVDEADSQLAIEQAPQTPPRTHDEAMLPHRSPGAISEMSGTTAISSFSQFVAEDLNPRHILRNLSTLYTVSGEFLAHLVPDAGDMEDDNLHIKEMHMPDSEFNEDFREYDDNMNLYLNRFRKHSQYIVPRAVRRALVGPEQDPDLIRSPVELVLYKANLLTFAKQGIVLDRGTGDTWTFLQHHDKFFPSMFLSSLASGHTPSNYATDSDLMSQTFELGLELRTQYFIEALHREANGFNDMTSDPDALLRDIFFQVEDDGVVNALGWEALGLGLGDSGLSREQRERVVEQTDDLRKYFLADTEDFSALNDAYPFDAFVLRLLDWVRLRHREIEGFVQNCGGADKLVQSVKEEAKDPNAAVETVTSPPSGKPRKSRTLFGRDRRRSKRKFDPNDDVHDEVLDTILAREKSSTPQTQQAKSQAAVLIEEAIQETIAVDEQASDDWQEPPVEESLETREAMDAEVSAPPRSTADYVKAYNRSTRLDKENRGGFFAPQAGAQRMEFGDGFDDTQPSPGPSSKAQGKQPQSSSPRKRRRQHEDESSNDEDVFETAERSSKATERRQEAPVRKKVRIDPGSSAPTSHQPLVRTGNLELLPVEQDESPSETEAPDMSEEIPTSSHRQIKQLARMNTQVATLQKPAQVRRKWSEEEEEVFQEYMAMFPQRYAQILEYDRSSVGREMLTNRTQVNLKDKARNMAMTMIKAGAGLSPGFENLITPSSSKGQELIAAGFDW